MCNSNQIWLHYLCFSPRKSHACNPLLLQTLLVVPRPILRGQGGVYIRCLLQVCRCSRVAQLLLLLLLLLILVECASSAVFRDFATLKASREVKFRREQDATVGSCDGNGEDEQQQQQQQQQQHEEQRISQQQEYNHDDDILSAVTRQVAQCRCCQASKSTIRHRLRLDLKPKCPATPMESSNIFTNLRSS